MAKEKKYYVVWKGQQTGVFDSWAEVKDLVQGFSGAQYKSFPDRALAEKAFNGNYADYEGQDFNKVTLSPAEIARIGQPVSNSYAVDAACSGSPGPLEYRGVHTRTRQEIFRRGPFTDGTNNVGEFLALVHALAYCQQRQITVPIYSDSRTAIAWVRQKRCKTKLQKSERNTELFEIIERAERWLRENKYENKVIKWVTEAWGEIPADFGRK